MECGHGRGPGRQTAIEQTRAAGSGETGGRSLRRSLPSPACMWACPHGTGYNPPGWSRPSCRPGHSERQPDGLDVIGGGNVAAGVPRWADAGRGERNGGPAGPAQGRLQAPASLPVPGHAEHLRSEGTTGGGLITVQAAVTCSSVSNRGASLPGGPDYPLSAPVTLGWNRDGSISGGRPREGRLPTGRSTDRAPDPLFPADRLSSQPGWVTAGLTCSETSTPRLGRYTPGDGGRLDSIR
jgi:hypothetical protein